MEMYNFCAHTQAGARVTQVKVDRRHWQTDSTFYFWHTSGHLTHTHHTKAPCQRCKSSFQHLGQSNLLHDDVLSL